MASQVEICNMALSHIGTKSSIAAIDEASKEAQECNLHYAAARDATLAEHDWDFARQTVALGLLDADTTLRNWTYQYAMPSDCLQDRRLYDETDGAVPIPYEIALAADGSARILLTDQEAAQLIYTVPVTNTELFSPQFVIAFSWRLAAAVAVNLTGKRELRNDALQMARAAIGEAKAANANSGYQRVDHESSFIEARA